MPSAATRQDIMHFSDDGNRDAERTRMNEKSHSACKKCIMHIECCKNCLHQVGIFSEMLKTPDIKSFVRDFFCIFVYGNAEI